MGGSESSAINYSCWYDYWSVGMINSLEASYWHAAARIRPRIVSIWGENFVLCEKAAKSRFEWELRIQLSQCVVKDTKGRLTMKGCFQCMIIVFVVLRGKWLSLAVAWCLPKSLEGAEKSIRPHEIFKFMLENSVCRKFALPLGRLFFWWLYGKHISRGCSLEN